LRTLVAVVDLRSFTKAAASLGVTQPAVSAQIKRLQFLLGADLFDRSAQGVSLTPQGEVVVSYARRLLSINDQIVDLGPELRPDVVIRVGTPSDFVATALPGTLARFRTRWPDVRFIVRTDYFDQLVRDLRGSEIDILVALSLSEPVDARHWRQQEVVWVRGENTRIDLKEPVPLVSHGEPSVYHRVAVQALRSAGLDWQDVFTGPSMTSLSSAVAAGLGVMAVTRRRAEAIGLPIWEDAPLPKLRDLFCGVYVRESGERSAYEQLADEIAKNLFPASDRMTGTAARLGGQRQANSAA
jgi:DNA-binding transcriptional LysR family regulator